MYTAKKYDSLIGLPGFSDQLLKDHFALYEKYVDNANKITEEIKSTKKDSIAFSELHRRFAWEYNGMRLHELFFENLVGNESQLQDSELRTQIENDFGSVTKWLEEFRSVASMRGIGWAVLFHDPFASKLTNAWINEHDVGHLVNNIPILVVDVFEHAYLIDYGIDRSAYLDAVFAAINWEVTQARFAKAIVLV